ncbi:hypothetical protein MSG28_007060 [Choristoneura fumiferana]|uniref:Uncharacterized protein n=1 Tax=Choristoneura fumiferana TaxID=7141 RepID=A0ACC0JMG0_CHOFU|nr:hypothetical protein MSG28_007060 [Choristoneura fumiferana]
MCKVGIPDAWVKPNNHILESVTKRNNEKRKEKSRVAARCRRTKEMQIFSELMDQLPAKKEEVEQLDKASVMRLAISYLRARDVVSLLPDVTKDQPKIENPKGVEQVTSELSYMKALDGFVLVLSQQGDIVYCSENIADHLGVSQVIHVTGHMLAPSKTQTKTEKNNNDDKTNDVDKKSGKMPSLVAVGRPIPHPSNIEIPLDSKTFLTKHSLDMKFTYIDETLTSTLGFDKDELVGHSLYDYHHSADSASLNHQFKSLFSKGQCETGQYRFLAKTGGYAWVQTQATVITDKQQKPISIVCVNYIIRYPKSPCMHEARDKCGAVIYNFIITEYAKSFQSCAITRACLLCPTPVTKNQSAPLHRIEDSKESCVDLTISRS